MYYLAYGNIQQPWILIFFQALMDTSDLSDVTAENLSDDDDNYDENYMSCITRIGDETTRCVLNFRCYDIGLPDIDLPDIGLPGQG